MLSQGKSLDQVEEILQKIVDDFIDEIISRDTVVNTDNIVKIEDYKLVRSPYIPSWTIYIRLEKLQTLQAYYASNSATASETAKLGKDICNALAACEEANVRINEVATNKLYVSNDGKYKIGGFGCEQKISIPEFMPEYKINEKYLAPEVKSGTRINAASNIYSVGQIMYERLSGGNLSSVEYSPLPNADENLNKIISKATAQSPDDRFSSFKEMERALYAYGENDSKSIDLILFGKAAEVFANDERAKQNSEDIKAAALAKENEEALLRKQAEAAAREAAEEQRKVEKLKKEQNEKAAKDLAEEKKAAAKREQMDKKLEKANLINEAKKEKEENRAAEKAAAEE